MTDRSQSVAVIVGVGAGLGAALARRFAERYAVALVARGQEKLDALASELGRADGKALAVPADVSKADEIERAAERIRRELGEVDMPIIRRLRRDLPKEDMLQPSAIAETYWHIAHQHPSAWTQEVDVRPFKEKF